MTTKEQEIIYNMSEKLNCYSRLLTYILGCGIDDLSIINDYKGNILDIVDRITDRYSLSLDSIIYEIFMK